ncbi:MAG: UvrD-helicase domain-containing protein, partial [Rikenellaceae bacterium]
MKNASVKILRASAGSGKTYRLAYEYIKRVVADPHSYRSILAVTFTNKATQEMKSRIIESLNALANFSDGAQVVYMDDLTRDLKLSEREVQRAAKVAKKYILHDYSNFAVSTIDKFFQRITRSFFKELGFDFGYEVELSSEHFLEKAVANVIQQSSGDENLTRLLERVVSRELESNKWNIRNRLIAIGKVLTRDNYRQNDNHDSADLATIMDMIAELHHAKEAQLRNIAAQWIDTLHQDNIEVEDVSFKETGFAGFIDKIARGGEIKPSSKRVINALNQDMKDWLSKAAQKAGKRVTDASLRDLLEQFVEQNHEFQLFNNSFRAANRHFDSRLLIDRLALELDKLMGQSNRLPIHRTTGLVAQIAENTEIPFIYEKLGTTYNTYMIDEFQDTSTSQWQGFLPLLQEVISHSGDQAVLLIGDVKQAIYRWRGGDWNILDSQAIRSFNAKNVDQNESLDTNWRSLRNIVDFNNDLFRSVIEIDSQEIDSFAAQSQLSDYNSILQNAYATYKQSPRSHSTGGYVELKITDEPLQETIRAIEELTTKHNYQLRDIAVLVRSNSEGEKMANNLISANYNVISDEALKISSSPTVRFVINIIKLSIDPSDAIAQAEVNLYRYNQINATDDEQSKEFVKSLSLLSAVSAFEAIIQHFSLQNKEISYLQALYQAL